MNGLACYAAEVEAFPEIPLSEAAPLRAIFKLAGAEIFAMAGRATQLLDWQKHHRFCGSCGTPTAKKADELVMECPSCGLLAYPRISPAVMVLVRDGDKLLLGRSPHFKPGVFSALAGFVEPGETIEDAVRREVGEESGIKVGKVAYFASQPWPFPMTLMLACFGEALSSEIRMDDLELEACRWFSRDELRQMFAGTHPDGLIPPQKLAVAHHLLKAFAEG